MHPAATGCCSDMQEGEGKREHDVLLSCGNHFGTLSDGIRRSSLGSTHGRELGDTICCYSFTAECRLCFSAA